jgi:hypothetical protein
LITQSPVDLGGEGIGIRLGALHLELERGEVGANVQQILLGCRSCDFGDPGTAGDKQDGREEEPEAPPRTGTEA